MKGINRPEQIQENNWHPESGMVECDCGELINISSNIEGCGEKLCRKCNLMYCHFNNRDGSGLRFNIKGYFPFYPDGYKFAIIKNH